MENKKEFLYNVLSYDDVNKSIRDNLNELINIIPEISPMIGFDHKHPHHHLDVWEHTLYALSLSPNNFDVRLSLLLHDIGKPHCFQEDNGVRHFKGHPEKSSQIAKVILQRIGFEKEYIKYICYIILHHDTPLTQEEIFNNLKLSKTIFNVQKCDALAHNPTKNKKRLDYIENTTKLFNIKEEKNESLSSM